MKVCEPVSGEMKFIEEIGTGVLNTNGFMGFPAMCELCSAATQTAFPLAGRGLHRYILRGRSCAGLWYALLTLAAASCEV